MKKIKLNKRKLLVLIIRIILFSIFIFFFIKILLYINDNNTNKNIKDKINKKYIIKENDNVNKYNIDFSALKEINPDTVAYLKVNGTNIDYVVVRGKDNDYYLNHNFEKKYNVSGWIFVDYKNILDGTDKNIVIYGHNTKDGSMFGTLKNVFKKEWYSNKDNLELVFVTENKTNIYKVFSTYEIEPENYYIKTIFNNDFNEFINTIKSRTTYNYNVNVNDKDNILTLSSCTNGGKKRLVLHAKRIE